MRPTRVFSEADRIAVAREYIEALATHRADDVAFAPHCTRIEMGVTTGFSGDHLRRSLNRGWQYRVIEELTIRDCTVVGDVVRARFELITKPSLAGYRVGASVDETFVIPADDGRIHHIRARVRPNLTH